MENGLQYPGLTYVISAVKGSKFLPADRRHPILDLTYVIGAAAKKEIEESSAAINAGTVMMISVLESGVEHGRAGSASLTQVCCHPRRWS